jgi:glycosyltransferase involved in cell wall biosynthesis
MDQEGVTVRIIYCGPVGICGGVRVLLTHVAELAKRGHQAEVWHVSDSPDWFGPVPHRNFAQLDNLGVELRKVSGAVKVATWWQTASWIVECLRPGDRGYYLVQDIETSYATTPEEAKNVLATYRMGLTPLAEAVWTRDRLLHMGLQPVHVGIGIDHEAFRPLPMVRDKSRIFTPYRTYTAGPNDLKGWNTARAACAEAMRRNPAASVVTFGVENGPDLGEHRGRTVHVKHPNDAKLRELYCEAGVFLMASRHEGFGLTAAEAMACGCPVVCTRADGNEEFCIDGETCLTAQRGDHQALAEACLELIGNLPLAARLAEAGREFVQRYQWSGVIDNLEREFGR